MANTLRFKRGLVAGIPNGALGEPLFTTDTFDLYIGNGTGNTRFQKYIASGATTQILRGDGSLYTFPLNISSPSNGQVLKYDGTNWVNSADAGVTGSGTAGQVTYWGSSSTITGSNSLFWDNTNGRLGIGTITPSTILNIFGTTPILAISTSNNSVLHGIEFRAGTTFDASIKQLPASGELQFNVGRNSSWGGLMTFFTDTTEKMRLTSTGNLLLGSTTNNGLRFQVTGDGFFSGSVGIGTSSLTGRSLSVSKNITGQYIFSGGSYGVGVLVDGVIQSDEVGGAAYFRSFAQTQAASFTAGAVYHFEAVQGTFGAGSTVSNQVGFFARETLIGATNNFGFYGNIASGTGRWNLYMNGTAANYLAGTLSIGTTANDTGYLRNYATIPVLALQNPTTGTATSDGFQLSVSGSLAYIWQYENSAMLFGTNATERMRLDASGNLGLGVTPSAWGNTFRVMDVGTTGSFVSFLSSPSAQMIANMFWTGSAWQYKTTGGASRVSLNANAIEFWNAASGTGGATITTLTQAMTLFATGNLAVGTTTDAGFRLDVNGTMRVSGATSFSADKTMLSAAKIIFNNTLNDSSSFLQNTGTTGNSVLYSSGKISIGITTIPTGSLLHVQGFASISNNSGLCGVTTGGNIVQIIGMNTSNNTIIGTTSSASVLTLSGTSSTFSGSVSVNGTGASISMTTAGDTALWSQVTNAGGVLYVGRDNAAGGSFGVANGHVIYGTGARPMAFFTNATERMRIDSTGNLGIGTLVPDARLRVAGAINSTQAIFGNVDGRGLAISTSIIGGTNEAGVILNARSSVTSGTFIFQTDGTQRVLIDSSGLTVTGGNGYEVVNSASNNVTALRPTGGGTSIMSTNSNGLHIAVGTEAAGDLILASNNTERIRLSSNGFFSQINATNPSSSITDSYIQYSADVTAGNAAPHFRTENGAVIKLYQETTGVGNAIFSQGGGNSVLDDSTFDGYTLRQIVKALRNQGILQ